MTYWSCHHELIYTRHPLLISANTTTFTMVLQCSFIIQMAMNPASINGIPGKDATKHCSGQRDIHYCALLDMQGLFWRAPSAHQLFVMRWHLDGISSELLETTHPVTSDTQSKTGIIGQYFCQLILHVPVPMLWSLNVHAIPFCILLESDWHGRMLLSSRFSDKGWQWVLHFYCLHFRL